MDLWGPLRNWRCRVCIVALFGLIHVGPTQATAQGAEVPLFLEVFVDGVSTDLVIEVAQTDAGFITDRAELDAVGIETRDVGSDRINLNAISGLRWSYDAAAQALYLQPDAARLAPQRIGPRTADRLAYTDGTGAALNYDLTLIAGQTPASSFTFEAATLGIDAWAFTGPARLRTTGLLSLPVRDGQSATWTRFETTLTVDNAERGTTLDIGDTITSSLSWGRTLRIGGVRLRNDFDLRPDLIRTPLPAFEGSVALPSTVDVFIADRRVYSGAIGEGRFLLQNIPVVSGAGTAIVSLEAADGSVTTAELPFFGSRDLLAKGVVDWSVEAGFPRLAFGVENAVYADDAVFNGTLRYGISDRVTLDLAAAAMRDFRTLALGLNTVIADTAEVSLTYGTSLAGSQRGHFHNVDFVARPFGVLHLAASRYRASPDYVDLATAIDTSAGSAGSPLDRERDVITLSMPSRNGLFSFGLSHIRLKTDARTRELTSLGLSRAVPQLNALFYASAGHDWQTDETNVSATMTFRLGDHTLQTSRGTQGDMGVLLSRPWDQNIGSWGYDIEAVRGDDGLRAAARLQTQGRYARTDLSLRRTPRRAGLNLRLQGAFAVMDRRIVAGPRINGGFAVVETGRPNVPVRLQNREVAVTDAGGRALISGLQPNANNRVSIDVDRLPGDSTWAASATDVVPWRTTGVAVDFGISDVTRTRLIRIERANGRPLPVATPVRVDGRAHDLGVGYDGLILLSDVSPGAVLETGFCTANVPPARADGDVAVARCQ